MYNSQMKTNKIILCKMEKSPFPNNLIDLEEEKKRIERTKPSVERRKLPSEKKYNQFVKDLYKKQNKKDIK